MKKFDIKTTYDKFGLGWTIAIVVIALLITFGIIFGLICLEAWIFMLLWNWIVPIFWAAAPILKFWGAFGTILLLDIIGGFFRIKIRRRVD